MDVARQRRVTSRRGTNMVEMPAKEQDALARAGDQLGHLLSRAGDYWERGEDVPPRVWRRIAEVSAEVSAYATALAGAQQRLETH